MAARYTMALRGSSAMFNQERKARAVRNVPSRTFPFLRKNKPPNYDWKLLKSDETFAKYNVDNKKESRRLFTDKIH